MSIYGNLPQQVEVRQHLAGAEHDRRQRILGHRERESRFLPEAFVEVLEQRPPSGKHDAAVDDIGRKFGGCALQRDADRVDDDIDGLGKRLREETGLPLAMAEDPLSSVVLGAGKMLSDFNLLRKISID